MIRMRLAGAFALAAASWIAAGCIHHEAVPPEQRPARWAEPLSRPGLPNFFRVSDALYRGAQPERRGFVELATLGVRTVVNLRSPESDDAIGHLALKRVSIPSSASKARDDQTAEFLRVVSDPANHPVFVHCQAGADRTGLVCAVYRIAVQGWTREDAIEEMTRGGFGFHAIYTNLVEYLEELDVDALRRKAGIAK